MLLMADVAFSFESVGLYNTLSFFRLRVGCNKIELVGLLQSVFCHLVCFPFDCRNSSLHDVLITV